MRTIISMVVCLLTIYYSPFTFAQEIPANSEQQLENQAQSDEAETEDDAWLQDLERFRKHPLNINSAEAEELKQLRIINDLQIASLIAYRNLLGLLVDIYELQAVPCWDIITIKKLIPFITISDPVSVKTNFKKRFRNGEHQLLLRVSQSLERSPEYDRSSPGTKFAGSPQRILFRYRYAFKNLLQYGLLGDKDAGEPFGKGAQKTGFDFYSVHFFAKNIGIIQSLAIGDYTVNMGQGLIQWQGLAFKKSADITGLKRQSSVLRPYNSAGEFYFHRGAGITIRKGEIESTVFISIRKLSANMVADTLNQERHISSLLASGYHRTENELADRNNFKQTVVGSNLSYRNNRFHAGVNAVVYQFSIPLEKKDAPYNLYSMGGKNWHNISADYSYTCRNLHLFGEAAADKHFNKAIISGVLLSADPKVDISLLYRHISAAYQSVSGNAFTENSNPTNEKGFFMGVALRPVTGWRIEAYADVFRFPWLKYQVDAPSRGTDYLAQLTFTPGKHTEIYTRFRTESKQGNKPGNTTHSNVLVFLPRQSWRTQVNYKVSEAITLRYRAELVWFDRKGPQSENGFLLFSDFIFKPKMKPFSGTVRLQYFESDDYNSRIYAYENDVMYSYSIPAQYGKGYRYYLNLNYSVSSKLSFWVRWSMTYFLQSSSLGQATGEIPGNLRTEIKAQARWVFGN